LFWLDALPTMVDAPFAASAAPLTCPSAGWSPKPAIVVGGPKMTAPADAGAASIAKAAAVIASRLTVA
jgi:hypothetical protein